MSEELIDRFIDRQAVKADSDFLKGELTSLKEAFDNLKNAANLVGGATNFKKRWSGGG